MHKTTVAAIKGVLDEYNRRQGNIFKVFVMSKKTGGFWQMCVVVDKEKQYFLPHVDNIAMAIGHMFGEGLYTDIRGDRIILS